MLKNEDENQQRLHLIKIIDSSLKLKLKLLWEQARKPRATLVWNYDWLTHWLTDLLTRVKCRATSVAKKEWMPEKYHVRARKVDMKKAKLAQKKEMCWLQVGGGSEQTFWNLQLRCPSRRAGSSPVFLVSQQTRWKERKRRNNHRERKLRWWTRGKCSTWQSLPLSAFAFLPRSPTETFLSFTWWADHHWAKAWWWLH